MQTLQELPFAKDYLVPKLNTNEDLQEMARQIRRDIIRMLVLSQSGHTGGSLGMADIFTALYFKILKHDREHFLSNPNQDFLFLSNGHISPVWYSTLARSGYFPISELASFRKINSRLQGHPATDTGLAGIRIASGSLGQGLSVAIGAALGFRLSGNENSVFCLMGDGECQEGQIWEAALSASHHKVDHLISIIDFNNQQIDGEVSKVMGIEPFHEKWLSFGWHVLGCDGNNIIDFLSTVDRAKKNRGSGKPTVILANTVMGKGVSFLEGTMPDGTNWHGKAPSKEQGDKALVELVETRFGDF
ncbi:MAG: transketolase [Chloroherpetonaceae bacterium]|nr:transketolase [Chloroherpetonaceae bacterium]